ncbi:WS/DGAT/MGAT family O-acyltransferase [Jatrophihabitans fulvus]
MTDEPLSPADAAWFHMDRRSNRLVVPTVLWFDEPLDWEALRQRWVERVVSAYPRFRHRVVDTWRGPRWQDDPHFDVAHHIRRVTLDEPGDVVALARLAGELVSQPMVRDRPPWEVWFVDGLGTGSAIVSRVHHCVADGVALFRVLTTLSDDADALDSATQAALASRRRPAVQRNAVADVVARADALRELLTMRADARTSLRGRAGPRKAVAWSVPLPLARMRAAAHEADATVNDLVLAALSGALRRHLARTDGRAQDVRAVLPVDLRVPLGLDPAGLGNAFGLVYVTLPVSEDLPQHRVSLVRQRTRALKRSSEATVSFRILELTGRLRYRAEQVVVGAFASKSSVVVTDVVGPRTPLSVLGHELAGTIGWPPESGDLGLGVSVISYAGRVTVGVLADVDTMGDPWRLVDDILLELDALGVRPEG